MPRPVNCNGEGGGVSGLVSVWGLDEMNKIWCKMFTNFGEFISLAVLSAHRELSYAVKESYDYVQKYQLVEKLLL